MKAQQIDQLVWPGRFLSGIPPSVDRTAPCFDKATNSTRHCQPYGVCVNTRSESQDPGHCECFSLHRDQNDHREKGEDLEEVGNYGPFCNETGLPLRFAPLREKPGPRGTTRGKTVVDLYYAIAQFQGFTEAMDAVRGKVRIRMHFEDRRVMVDDSTLSYAFALQHERRKVLWIPKVRPRNCLFGEPVGVYFVWWRDGGRFFS